MMLPSYSEVFKLTEMSGTLYNVSCVYFSLSMKAGGVEFSGGVL